MTETQNQHQMLRPQEEKRDEELVHELFKVFPRVFSKKEPRDEYFASIVSKGDVTIEDVIKAPIVQAVTPNPDIIRRAIARFRGFTVNEEIIKLNTYRNEQQNTLVVRDLPVGLQYEQVMSLFQSDSFPGLKPISARPDLNNTWYVNFATEDDARQGYNIGKNASYDGKPIRVNIKRDGNQRNGFDGRANSYVRNEYPGIEVMQPMPIPPMMGYPPMYYPPPMMAHGQAYYPYANSIPYPHMNAPLMYPADMQMMYPYYTVPAGYPAYPTSPMGQQTQQQQQFRRPGRDNKVPSSPSNPGRAGSNGSAAKEKSASQDQPLSDDVAAEVEVSKPVVFEAPPVESRELTSKTEGSASGSADSGVDLDAKEETDPNESDRRRSKEGKDSKARNEPKKGPKSAQGNNNAKQIGKREKPLNGTAKVEKEKVKAPAVNFTMDSDFPILVDQKQSFASGQPKAFDYANAVRKAQTNPVVAPQVHQPIVIEQPPEMLIQTIIVEPPVQQPAVQELVRKVVESDNEEVANNKLATPTASRKSFLDALRSNN